MVPRSWIKECMQIFGIAKNIQNFLGESMKTGRTELTAYGAKLGDIRMRREIS